MLLCSKRFRPGTGSRKATYTQHRNHRNFANDVNYYELYLKAQDRLHVLDTAEELAKFDPWLGQTRSIRTTVADPVRTLARETKKQHQHAAAKRNERQAVEFERDELLQKAAQICIWETIDSSKRGHGVLSTNRKVGVE